jgi:hypothetical protein
MVSAQAQATNAEHEDEYDVLRSFFNWRRTQAEAPLNQNDQPNLQPSRYSRSPQLSIFRTIVYGVIVAVVAFGGLQAYRNETTKETISAWWGSSAAWVSFLQQQYPVGAKAGAATSPRSLDPTASAITPTPEATEASKLSHEIQQQLQTIASDLAVVRRTVEQLANKQDQMAQEISSVQAAQQNAIKATSSIAQTLTRIQRNNAQNVIRSERAQQSSSAPSVVSQSVGTNTTGANAPPAQ